MEALQARIEALEKETQALTQLVNIIWQTKGPEGSFRCYFRPERFADEAALESYLKEKVPVWSLSAAKKEGQLEGTPHASRTSSPFRFNRLPFDRIRILHLRGTIGCNKARKGGVAHERNTRCNPQRMMSITSL